MEEEREDRNKGQERTKRTRMEIEVLEESILKKCSRDYEAQVLENVLEIRKTQNPENGFLTVTSSHINSCSRFQYETRFLLLASSF